MKGKLWFYNLIMHSSGLHYFQVQISYIFRMLPLSEKRPAFDLLAVIPANIVTAVVIIKNKELWTSSNVVLAINGLVQATGSLICLVGRFGFAILPYFGQNQKHAFYVRGWWSYTIMMRTGNNRLAIKSQIFYWNLQYKN